MPRAPLLMIAILTGMPSIAQVASSWLVIWKQPSPSMAQTVASGMPTLAPMAAGTAKPMVPAPPELIQVRGFSQPMCWDARRVGAVGPGQLADPLDHVLRRQAAVVGLVVAERVLAAPLLQLCPPFGV